MLRDLQVSVMASKQACVRSLGLLHSLMDCRLAVKSSCTDECADRHAGESLKLPACLGFALCAETGTQRCEG